MACQIPGIARLNRLFCFFSPFFLAGVWGACPLDWLWPVCIPSDGLAGGCRASSPVRVYRSCGPEAGPWGLLGLLLIAVLSGTPAVMKDAELLFLCWRCADFFLFSPFSFPPRVV